MLNNKRQANMGKKNEIGARQGKNGMAIEMKQQIKDIIGESDRDLQSI